MSDLCLTNLISRRSYTIGSTLILLRFLSRYSGFSPQYLVSPNEGQEVSVVTNGPTYNLNEPRLLSNKERQKIGRLIFTDINKIIRIEW